MAQQTAPAPAARPEAEHDFMPLNGVDHVELYVGNALQSDSAIAAHQHRHGDLSLIHI